MTIKQFLVEETLKVRKVRYEKLKALDAPKVVVDAECKAIAALESGAFDVGGDKELLEQPFIGVEEKVGRGGKVYYVFNATIRYFPQAAYGRYITR